MTCQITLAFWQKCTIESSDAFSITHLNIFTSICFSGTAEKRGTPLRGELKDGVQESHTQNNEYTCLISILQILLSFLFLSTLATKS